MTTPTNPTPLVCDMTTAPDTPQQRMAEYGRLFEHALIGRERTTNAAILRFTARAGVEAWGTRPRRPRSRLLPFFNYTVTEHDGEISYKIAGDDDPIVQGILDEFYQLPEHISDGLTGLLQRLHDTGLDVQTNADGNLMSAT